MAVFSNERERREGEEDGGGASSSAASCQLEALRGRDGRDGRDGVQGEKGDRGDVGPRGEKGENGIKGETGMQGEKGPRGQQGISGAQGLAGINGERGEKGDRGSPGVRGPQGPPPTGGGVYIRWGRTSCPNVTGTELVYSGRAGGSSDGTDYVCLPNDPEYYSSSNASGTQSIIGAKKQRSSGWTRQPQCSMCRLFLLSQSYSTDDPCQTHLSSTVDHRVHWIPNG